MSLPNISIAQTLHGKGDIGRQRTRVMARLHRQTYVEVELTKVLALLLGATLAGCAAPDELKLPLTSMGPPQKVVFACPAEGLQTKWTSDAGKSGVTTWQGADPADPVVCKTTEQNFYSLWSSPVALTSPEFHQAFAAAFAGSTQPNCFRARTLNPDSAFKLNADEYSYCVSQLGSTFVKAGGKDVPAVALLMRQRGYSFSADYTIYYDLKDKLVVRCDVRMHYGKPVPSYTRTIV